MSRRKIGLTLLSVSFFWLMVGWFANGYWQQRTRSIQSGMALITAQEAAHNGDYDMALEYAAYAYAYDSDSPLADIQIKEFIKRREKLRCDEKLVGPTALVK